MRSSTGKSSYLCSTCHLVFLDPVHFIPPAEERRHYLTHENGPQHAGHVAFVRRIIDPLSAHLSPGMRGLDFGCGPIPVVPHLLKPQGIECDTFDPFFANHPLHPPYDFVVAVEVFEHFRLPGRELDKLLGLLTPGGLLAVMTERWQSEQQFAHWYYMRDPTHVAFYHHCTFNYICERYGLVRCFDDGQRVVVLRRCATM